MRQIEDGIRCDQQPPQNDCCNCQALDFIIIYGERQWLCPRHYDEHFDMRGLLRMNGEGLDVDGNAL